jgi:hypothetical protein
MRAALHAVFALALVSAGLEPYPEASYRRILSATHVGTAQEIDDG